jgi:hypothetical protein
MKRALTTAAAGLAAVLSVGLFAVLVAQGTGPDYCPPWVYHLPLSPEAMLTAAAAIFVFAALYVANRSAD